ncbi:MAG: FAD-binding oxidoreductase [Hamadaea sp.]|uniref:FAD-binding oxidoreductase n=1 Tax=Hamadaea sp. TaxID=2024425 RepID=UPI001842E9F1|nr:FAD-binding oxidoreductase [Hamadaea sp.]NUR72574.1 FAD-binding oxidoreductase [Hamadaea sp.]NUT22217.1 FAD-binding oxidoreductase [Hamadaea sp.]
MALFIPDTFRGEVVRPEDSAYDELRQVVAGDVDKRPAVILRPVDAPDVAVAVAVARDSGLPLAVRCGGHSGAGHSAVDDGVVLDVRKLKTLEIDAEGKTAWAGAGLTAGEYTKAVGEHGLATGFGDTGSVGLGGITLAGGVGFLVRKYGMTIDNLLAAEVVTADGEILHVDETSHPELFWAIRGGGGNFGVVTKFQYRLHDVGEFVGGMLMLPATPEVITGAIEIASSAPEELSAIINVMTAPPAPFIPEEVRGKLVVMALLGYAGPPAEAEKVLAPLRALATPIMDSVRPMAYAEMFPPEDASYRPTAVGENMFVDTVDGSAVEAILKRLTESDAPMRVTQIRPLGGAMARVASDATAFAHRDAAYMVNLAAFYTSPADRIAKHEWITSFRDQLETGMPRAYVGFVADADNPERVRAAYPAATYDRLVAVKQQYDPANLFRLNQNIPA